MNRTLRDILVLPFALLVIIAMGIYYLAQTIFFCVWLPFRWWMRRTDRDYCEAIERTGHYARYDGH